MNRRNGLNVNLNLNVRGLHPSATLAINEKSNQLIKEGRKIYKLGLGQSPFPVPEVVQEALRQNAHQKDYLPVKGLRELREAVAGFNTQRKLTEYSDDDIIIGPGSKELIFLLQLVYYGELIIPTPSWVSYAPQARIIGRHVNWVQTSIEDNWHLMPEKLDTLCRIDPDRPRIVILNYPANPTGDTYKIERLKELAEVARKYGVVLISDEIYGLIHHLDKHVSIARFYPEGTIVSSGLSKWCGAGGWRLGTFSFPRSLRWLQDAMAIVASETYTATSAPIQYAAVTAYNGHPEIDDYLHHSRRILRVLAGYISKKLEEMKLRAPELKGAFYAFPDFNYYKDAFRSMNIYTDVEMCNRILNDLGIAMLPGCDFGPPPDLFTARIAYVDFNGKEAIEASREHKNGSLNEKFVREHCPKIVESFDLLGNWLQEIMKRYTRIDGDF